MTVRMEAVALSQSVWLFVQTAYIQHYSLPGIVYKTTCLFNIVRASRPFIIAVGPMWHACMAWYLGQATVTTMAMRMNRTRFCLQHVKSEFRVLDHGGVAMMSATSSPEKERIVMEVKSLLSYEIYVWSILPRWVIATALDDPPAVPPATLNTIERRLFARDVLWACVLSRVGTFSKPREWKCNLFLSVAVCGLFLFVLFEVTNNSISFFAIEGIAPRLRLENKYEWFCVWARDSYIIK